jgi:hypothetical protein
MLYALVLLLAYLWLLWGVYVLVMGLYRAHLQERLTNVTLVLGLPFIVLGYLMDILANIFIATIVFVELPKEWLVTTRLIRHQNESWGWRAKLSFYICEHLLDVFDPKGNHC